MTAQTGSWPLRRADRYRERASVAEPTSSDRPVESSRRCRLSHLYFRYVAFYCRSFLAPLQTHPARQLGLFFPQFPESPQTWHRSNRSLSTYARVAYQWPVLRQPERFCVLGVFSRLPYCHARHIVYRHFPFSPIVLKHRERQRGCALRHGGLLLRDSRLNRSWFLPLGGHAARKQTSALGSCLPLAPSGPCALRDSGHQKEKFDV